MAVGTTVVRLLEACFKKYGKIKSFNESTDLFIYPGFKVTPHYDSMLAKLIVWGADRAETLQRADRALEEFIIDGVTNTIPFHQKLIKNSNFIDMGRQWAHMKPNGSPNGAQRPPTSREPPGTSRELHVHNL